MDERGFKGNIIVMMQCAFISSSGYKASTLVNEHFFRNWRSDEASRASLLMYIFENELFLNQCKDGGPSSRERVLFVCQGKSQQLDSSYNMEGIPWFSCNVRCNPCRARSRLEHSSTCIDVFRVMTIVPGGAVGMLHGSNIFQRVAIIFLVFFKKKSWIEFWKSKNFYS